MQEPERKKNSVYRAEGIKVMGVAFELGFIIALPILALATLGKWLDNRYHQGFYIYVGIVLAVISSSLWMYKRFSEMIRKLEEAAKMNQKTKEHEDKPDKEQE